MDVDVARAAKLNDKAALVKQLLDNDVPLNGCIILRGLSDENAMATFFLPHGMFLSNSLVASSGSTSDRKSDSSSLPVMANIFKSIVSALLLRSLNSGRLQ